MNNIMDGKLASQALKMSLKKKIEFENLTPSLTVIQVGDNKASNIY